MMDPPRHTCRGRPMVCPGPCNPLRAHHHHHHRRHHRHQKPDVTGVTIPGKDISLPDEFSQITLLTSLKTDASVTSMTSADDTSISRTSSSRIAVIRIPKTPRTKKTDVPAIIQQILSPGRLEMLREPSKPRTEKTNKSAPAKKIESPIPTETTVDPKKTADPKETATRTVAYQEPRNDETCAIMTRLNGLTKRASLLFLCLTILMIYAGIHILLAVIAWRTPAYQFFVSSQICGVLVFLMWRLTGTILI